MIPILPFPSEARRATQYICLVLWVVGSAVGCTNTLSNCTSLPHVALQDGHLDSLEGTYQLYPYLWYSEQSGHCFVDSTWTETVHFYTSGSTDQECQRIPYPDSVTANQTAGHWTIQFDNKKTVHITCTNDSLGSQHVELRGKLHRGGYRLRPCLRRRGVPLVWGSAHRQKQTLWLLTNGDLVISTQYHAIGGVLVVFTFGFQNEQGYLFKRMK